MNQKLRQILFGVALVLTGSFYAQQTINVSTGWNNGVVALNTLDDSWNVTLPGSSTPVTPKSCQNSGLWDYTDCSRWISPAVASNGVALNSPQGTYTFRMNFTINPQTINCARFIINAIGADNTITGFSINGNSYFSSLGMPTNTNNHFDPLKQNVEFYITPAHLVVGTNTITVTTNNNPFNGEGTEAAFNLCGEIRINEDFNIHPVVTGPTTICQGSPLTFGGALAAGSNPSTHYSWRLLECDAAGNLVNGGFSWEMWYTGVPTGNYTFPSNLNITCGKYYMAVLSAVKESSCANWAQDIHVFNYVCKPNANAGADQTICQGECATIGTNILQKGVSYNWSANGTYVGSGINISVCPQTTTTYTLTATNNLTGCSNTDQVVVTVLPNNPDFDIQTHTYADYYSLTATPVVMNANIFSGFGQYWSVEEMGANNSTVFNIQNPPVWFPYPASCTFTGFDDYLLNYSGTVNTLPNAPTYGRFVYNKLYRITRGTWNDNCDWNAVSYLLQRNKSANGEDVIVITETKAPASRPGMVEEQLVNNNWNISPNPSTGMFVVASEYQETKETVFEVFDLFGKKVLSKVIEAGTTSLSLDLSGNAKGVYILNITTDGVNKAHKIVVE